MPKVSVVIATYRRTDRLLKALESTAAQTYRDFEIVLADDNGDPEWNGKVHGILENFRSRYPDIMLKYIVNRENLGSARTRNAGIEAAEGEYVCFLDDDDLYLPARIERQLIPMEQGGADYSITNLELYADSGVLIEKRNREYIRETTPAELLKYHLMYHMTGTDTMMFRKDYLLKIGCFSPIDVGDEYYLMLKAIQGGGKFLHVPVCDVKAIVHTGEGGLSSGQGKIDGENQLFEYKKQFFDQLDGRSRRYIRMRHHAVLAFACIRMRNYGGFLSEGIRSFLSSPLGFLKLLYSR